MLIPYRSDALLYHYPFATVGLIVVNVILYWPMLFQDDPYGQLKSRDVHEQSVENDDSVSQNPFGAERLKQLVSDERPSGKPPIWRLMTLEFGRFRPWQWLTASYMHGGLMHLLGNMFVLWGFGLVVEGKVGWWRFLLIYNGIGIAGWAFVQLVMLKADGGIGLGASLPIFGIVVIALLWAPTAEMECIFIFGLRPIMFEASIMTIAAGALGLQVVISVFHIMFLSSMGLGMRITSEFLHLIGAVIGLVIGFIMLNRRWVDCDNGDAISVWQGKHERTREEDEEEVRTGIERMKAAERLRLAPAGTGGGHFSPASAVPAQPRSTAIAPTADSPPSAPPRSVADELVAEFRRQVAAGDLAAASSTLQRGESCLLGWCVPEPDFVNYVSAWRKQQNWEAAAAAMEQYLLRYGEREVPIRLALAQIQLQYLNRPDQASSVLDAMDASLLEPSQKASFDKLRAAAKRQLE